MPNRFCLTFDVVTEESAQDGEAARSGWVPDTLEIPDDDGPATPTHFGLRDAVEFLLGRESQGPAEADSAPLSRSNPPRWFTYGGEWDSRAKGWVRVSLHLPRTVTPSTAMRIARLVRCYGIRTA